MNPHDPLVQAFILRNIGIGARQNAVDTARELRAVLDLADEAATRRNYEFYLKQPHAPRITFEEYALAFGEKRVPSDDELRIEYDRLCRDLKRDHPLACEYFPPPTFEEFKQAYMEDSHA